MGEILHTLSRSAKVRSALLRSERGATAVEYGLICAMIVLAMLAALQTVATKTTSMWDNVSNEVLSH